MCAKCTETCNLYVKFDTKVDKGATGWTDKNMGLLGPGVGCKIGIKNGV